MKRLKTSVLYDYWILMRLIKCALNVCHYGLSV